MGMSRQSRWTDLDDGTAVEFPTTARVLAAVRAVCTPSTLVLAGVVGFSWLALIGWTGAGSDSWQARTCAGLDQPPASCGSVRPRKDQSRLVPHDSVAGPSS